jgi:hypothetical protein
MSRDPMDLELATNAVLADSRDTAEMLQLLARQLSGVLGPRVEIRTEGGRFRKSDRVRSLVVRMGAEEFVATVERGGVETTIGHDSAGIRIRTEKVAAGDWLARLLGALRVEAETNQAARAAIEGLVLGSD